jgi:hypothetical protein
MITWTTILFFSLAIIICCTLAKKGSDFLSPARIFGLTWCIVFCLVSLKLSRLQLNWTAWQWIYMLLGPISFLLGLFFNYAININAQLLPIKDIRRLLKNQKINDSRLFFIIIIAFITYIGGYAIIYFVKGYVPIFTANPAAARNDYSVFAIGMLTHNMPVVVFF